MGKAVTFCIITVVGLVSCKVQQPRYTYDKLRIHNDSSSFYDNTYHTFFAYFSKGSCVERGSHFSSLVKSDQVRSIPHVVGYDMIEDLSVLSGYKAQGSYDIGSDDGEFVVTDESRFEIDIKNWQEGLKEKSYLTENSEGLVIPQKIKYHYLEHIEYYVQNKPDNRIRYIEKYLHEIPFSVIQLFKIDLDGILEIGTPGFLSKEGVNAFAFEEAKLLWLSKLEDK